MLQLRAGGIQHALRVPLGENLGSLSGKASEPIPHVSSLADSSLHLSSHISLSTAMCAVFGSSRNPAPGVVLEP